MPARHLGLIANDAKPGARELLEALIRDFGQHPVELHFDLRDIARMVLAGLQEGTVPIKTDADRLAVLRLLPMGDPTPWAMEQIVQSVAKSGEVGRTANAVARSFAGSIPPTLLAVLWKPLADSKTGIEQRIELLATVALIESEPDAARWTALLTGSPDAKSAADVTFPRIPRIAFWIGDQRSAEKREPPGLALGAGDKFPHSSTLLKARSIKRRWRCVGGRSFHPAAG